MNNMKLELKHLSPYLPYKLNVMDEYNNEIYPLCGFNIERNHSIILNNEGVNIIRDYSHIKPILRPLSDLNNIITVNNENIKIYDIIKNIADCKNAIPRFENCVHSILYGYKENIKRVIEEDMPIYMYNKLIEYHFDLFSLIDNGLAIDINLL